MKRSKALFLGIAISGALISGCSNQNSDSSNANPRETVRRETAETELDSEEASEREDEPTSDKSEKDQQINNKNTKKEADEKDMKVYLPNKDATALVEVEVKESKKPNASREEVVVENLKEKETGNAGITKAIREDIAVNEVRVEKDMAIVDLSGKNLTGSGLEEGFLIDSVVMSLTSLEGINSVQFLVDGEKRETLMGHYLIDSPLTADEVGYNITE